MKATAIANSNIAFIKYWGKKDENLNIPLNPSISMTMDNSLSTKTTVDFSDKYHSDEFYLNDHIQSGDKLLRVIQFLDIIRNISNTRQHAKVHSKNSFPTGSGIASSASGFAALAAAATKALKINLTNDELSSLARRGSGSAARSVHGGFVEWKEDKAVQLLNERHWPELIDIIVIVSSEEKAVSSREGMKLTVKTSLKFQERQKSLLQRIQLVKQYLMSKDFQNLAKVIMQDSDDLHICMEDTQPPLFYLNPLSQEIKRRIHKINAEEIKAAYTFDAGPNAHIITLEKYKEEILKNIKNLTLPFFVSRTGEGITYTEDHLV